MAREKFTRAYPFSIFIHPPGFRCAQGLFSHGNRPDNTGHEILSAPPDCPSSLPSRVSLTWISSKSHVPRVISHAHTPSIRPPRFYCSFSLPRWYSGETGVDSASGRRLVSRSWVLQSRITRFLLYSQEMTVYLRQRTFPRLHSELMYEEHEKQIGREYNVVRAQSKISCSFHRSQVFRAPLHKRQPFYLLTFKVVKQANENASVSLITH